MILLVATRCWGTSLQVSEQLVVFLNGHMNIGLYNQYNRILGRYGVLTKRSGSMGGHMQKGINPAGIAGRG